MDKFEQKRHNAVKQMRCEDLPEMDRDIYELFIKAIKNQRQKLTQPLDNKFLTSLNGEKIDNPNFIPNHIPPENQAVANYIKPLTYKRQFTYDCLLDFYEEMIEQGQHKEYGTGYGIKHNQPIHERKVITHLSHTLQQKLAEFWEKSSRETPNININLTRLKLDYAITEVLLSDEVRNQEDEYD